jgi:hypothetical protein
MAVESIPGAESVRWKGREATRLANGVIELTTLTSGGHMAALRLSGDAGGSCENVFWEPPWPTYDQQAGLSREQLQTYGPPDMDKFMAGYTGHCLCLDYFGAPSAEQGAAGLGLHGEAPVARWLATQPALPEKAQCQWNVTLPAAYLQFSREIRLGKGESVAYIEEIVRNQRDVDRACDWVQHATFGPPFLQEGESTLSASGKRGKTWPLEYEGGLLLAKDREFDWPYAPTDGGEKAIDLRQPFAVAGRGFIATTLLDPRREIQYVVAANWRMRLGVGYCFRRQDFPWMTIWEENCSRQSSPWNGRTRVRGMEFGTTPLPLGREESFRRGPLFDTPSWCVIPAGGEKTARYLMFVFAIPAAMQSIRNVTLEAKAIVLFDEQTGSSVRVPVHGGASFLSKTGVGFPELELL